MTNKDTVQVVLSDTHSGSNYALFLPRQWEGIHTSHFPRSGQIEIRKEFERCAERIAQARKNKKVILVINGDAVDGDHHNSGDVCTTDIKEQADIHIELMTEFQKRIKWQRGDELYYTKGTQTHTNEMEDYIGREMNAVPSGQYYSWNFLELVVNGVTSWFVHHGPSAGKGANEGNSIRNWLRNIYYDAQKDGDGYPDIVYTGHVHNPTYDTFTLRDGMKFKQMHGIITPSWQMKTRYAWMKAPVSKNKIGGCWQEIKADGTIMMPQFSVMGYE